MIRLLRLLALALFMLTAFPFPAAAASVGGEVCKSDGYTYYLRADGTPFDRAADCRSYVKKGGLLYARADLRVTAGCTRYTAADQGSYYQYVGQCWVRMVNVGSGAPPPGSTFSYSASFSGRYITASVSGDVAVGATDGTCQVSSNNGRDAISLQCTGTQAGGGATVEFSLLARGFSSAIPIVLNGSVDAANVIPELNESDNSTSVSVNPIVV